MNRKLVYASAALVVVIGTGYFLIGGSDNDDAEADVGQITRTVTVTKGNLDLTVSANGVVQPIDKVEIRSKAGGRIEQLNFEEGQIVQKGDLLIALDQTTARNDNEQAKADLQLAQSAVKQAENNFRRSMEMYDKKLISSADRDQAEVDRVRAESQLVKAKANLSSTEDRLHDTRVIAPITGMILSRAVSLGQIISSATSNVGGGTLLGTIADMEQVYVETNVDEVDIGKVAVGQNAKVVADAFPDDTFNGQVIRIAPQGTTQQNVTTFTVTILVRNIGGKLKAGMSASVDIEIFRRRDVLLVPTEALKDPKSEQGRILLASMKEDPKEEAQQDSAKSGQQAEAAPASPEQMRQRFASMSPEEQQKYREQMRARFQKMSPEERQKAFAQMRAQGGGGMGFRGGGGQGGRRSQVGDVSAVRQRVVEVKVGNEFVPRMVKVGASNYDVAEIVGGLKEGDEIRITTISRAKMASEAFNQRIRNMSSMGGIGGRRGR